MLCPGVSKTATPPCTIRKLVADNPFDPFDLGQNQLRYAVATFQRDRFRSEVNQDDLDLTTVIGIDGPGSIEHC